MQLAWNSFVEYFVTELGRMYVTILIHTHRLSWPHWIPIQRGREKTWNWDHPTGRAYLPWNIWRGQCCPRPLRHWWRWSTKWRADCPHNHRGGLSADRQWWWKATNPLWWGTSASPIQSKGIKCGVEGSSYEVSEASGEEATPHYLTRIMSWFIQNAGEGFCVRNNCLFGPL